MVACIRGALGLAPPSVAGCTILHTASCAKSSSYRSISICNPRSSIVSRLKSRNLSFESKHHNVLQTQMKVCDSGFRVAAIPSQGHFAALGLYIDAGSRYETDHDSGSSHFLDRIAFKSTKMFSRDELLSKIESKIGGVVAHSSREAIIYQMSFFRHNLDTVVNLLAQVSLWPNFLPEEIEEVRNCIMYELEEIEIKHDLICSELLHKVAFRSGGNVAGLSRKTFMEEGQLEKINPKILKEYLKTWYTPDRMVLAGVGVDLEKLLELTDKYFCDLTPKSPEIADLQYKLSQNSLYGGGIDIEDLSSLRRSQNPDDLTLTHVYLAVEGLSMYDPDVYTQAVLSTIMGGGGSFSAGGPGKGMYTKLYSNVLNRYSWVENCSAINVSYKESGLFGIGIAVTPGRTSHSEVVHLLCDQLKSMPDNISDTEIERAKCQLQSNLLSNLENRLTEAEDLGRQILYFGTRILPEEIRNRIKQITKSDIIRVINRIIFNQDLKSPFNFPELSSFNLPPRGSGKVSLVVRAPFIKNDPLLTADQLIASYGFKV